MAVEVQTSRPPLFPRWALNAQIFLLRRGWIKPLNNNLMVLTLSGRKSDKVYSIPITYIRDGNDILAFTLSNGRNWYKNVQVKPDVTLEVRGKTLRAKAHVVDMQDDAAVIAVMQAYQRAMPRRLPSYFGVAADADQAGLLKVQGKAWFVRFRPV